MPICSSPWATVSTRKPPSTSHKAFWSTGDILDFYGNGSFSIPMCDSPDICSRKSACHHQPHNHKTCPVRNQVVDDWKSWAPNFVLHASPYCSLLFRISRLPTGFWKCYAGRVARIVIRSKCSLRDVQKSHAIQFDVTNHCGLLIRYLYNLMRVATVNNVFAWASPLELSPATNTAPRGFLDSTPSHSANSPPI